ncbi:phosphoglucomutase/phosphomannomutase family protein [Enorma phocaeensis]|uniref:phosphoglucomutase/phosphomannomutase family protein n=1 Tax=Enorma phocaeensis TaxID=1871019 RepID=UPI002356AD51|nr:phosphoglucomutase/phosphomannomutase family protein [Enorma phocaeensis]
MCAMIHFGTDGWFARRDGDFTEESVARVADAAAEFWGRTRPGDIVYVAYDARQDAESFAVLAGRVLAARGLVAMVSNTVAPTPALAWTISRDQRACGGIMVTGSHNPQDYLGIKLFRADGAMLSSDETDEVENALSSDAPEERGAIKRIDLVTSYLDALYASVDGDLIAGAHLKVIYDSLYGAGAGWLPAVLGALGVEIIEIHDAQGAECDDVRPDPVEPWVDDCERAVQDLGAVAGFVTDGDADRAGIVDENGRFVGPDKMCALVLEHLVVNRGYSGRVVLGLSASALLRRVAASLGCRITTKPVGYEYLYKEMLKGDALVAFDENGAMGLPDWMPERDGFAVCLLICELMAKSGKTLSHLVDGLDERFGSMYRAKRNLKVENEVVEMFRTMLPGLNPRTVAGREPVAVSHMDGLRMEFEDESWLLMRPSRTKPIVRVYAEAPTIAARDELLEAGCDIARGEDEDSGFSVL